MLDYYYEQVSIFSQDRRQVALPREVFDLVEFLAKEAVWAAEPSRAGNGCEVWELNLVMKMILQLKVKPGG